MSPARQCVKALNNKAWLACADNNTEIEMITYILTCSPVVIIHRKPSSQLKACRFYLAGSWLVNILKNQYKSQSILFVVSHYVFFWNFMREKKERKRERESELVNFYTSTKGSLLELTTRLKDAASVIRTDVGLISQVSTSQPTVLHICNKILLY